MTNATDSIRKVVLDTAASAVLTNRQSTYGGPEDNFTRIQRLWNAHLENAGRIPVIQPEDVAIFLLLVKLARLAQTPTHFDSWVDIAGYAACGAEVTPAVPPSNMASTAASPLSDICRNCGLPISP